MSHGKTQTLDVRLELFGINMGGKGCLQTPTVSGEKHESERSAEEKERRADRQATSKGL